MRGSLLARFNVSAGILLALTGAAKLLSIFGGSGYLTTTDPVSGLQFRQLLLSVGVVELVVAGLCFTTRSARAVSMVVAWLAANFFIYRMGLWWIGWRKPCGCLGNLTDALHISPVVADNVMKGVLAYLLLGSCVVLWSDRKRGKASTPTSVGAAPSGV